MPWLSKNSAMKRAGKLHICCGSADQTADAWGTISRSMNGPREALLLEPVTERRPVARRLRSSVRAARLKRTRSATMR